MRGVLLVAFGVGCSTSVTEPGRPAPTVSISKAVRQSYPYPPPRTVSTVSSVIFTAILTTGTPCYSVGATDRIEGQDLIIKLVAKPNKVACVQMTVVAQYTVTSLDVPIAVTHVRVEQTGFIGSSPVLVDMDIRSAQCPVPTRADDTCPI